MEADKVVDDMQRKLSEANADAQAAKGAENLAVGQKEAAEREVAHGKQVIDRLQVILGTSTENYKQEIERINHNRKGILGTVLVKRRYDEDLVEIMRSGEKH